MPPSAAQPWFLRRRRPSWQPWRPLRPPAPPGRSPTRSLAAAAARCGRPRALRPPPPYPIQSDLRHLSGHRRPDPARRPSGRLLCQRFEEEKAAATSSLVWRRMQQRRRTELGAATLIWASCLNRSERVFKVSREDVRKADRNLDEYLQKRVSDLIYQARLDAVKFHAKCDDNQARTIHLTEEEYINSKLAWCAQDAWRYLSKYWTSERYMEKRKIAQASRLKSKDPAQNRGGSRPFAETQKLLQYKFGPNKASTVNTYTVMKSGFKKVDSTGKSAPIPSRKAQTRLANYSTRTQLHENSKDVQALYVMEHGMAHGRVPIGDGCVDKQALAATAKSHRSSARTAAYQNMVDEYEQLKEWNEALERTNKKLNENNEILIEENGVNRELMLRIFEDLNKQPPADLMDRLANLEARRHQVSKSSHATNHPHEMLSDASDIVTDDDDYDYNEMDDSNSFDDDDDIYDDFDDDDDGCDDSRGGEDDISNSHEGEDGGDNNGADINDNNGDD